jgi:hypothetical protein
MNPFVTPEGSPGDDHRRVAAAAPMPNTAPSHSVAHSSIGAGGPAPPVSSATSASESQPPTLRDFPRPPTKNNPVRTSRPPRAVAWSDKLSIVSAREKYTFYREPTPPPEDPLERPKLITDASTYDYKYDHVAPPAPIPVPTICGLTRRVFLIALAALILIIALAVGVGVGVGVGTKGNSSSGEAESQTGDNAVTTTTVISSIATDMSTTAGPATASTDPTATLPTTSASTVSSNPAITTLVQCPAANDTIFDVPGSDQKFRRICGVDYTGKNSAVDLAHAWTPTFEDCMLLCAGYPDCEACGWGVIKGDPGSYHRCWLKGNLKESHTARTGWHFAILQ